MPKLNIYCIVLIISFYLSQIDKSNLEIALRSLKPKSSNKKNSDSQQFKLLQTLYTDSPSNNYYYTILYLTDKQVKQTYIIDTGIETMTSLCAPCEYCGKQKTNYYDLSSKKLNNALKCGSKVCKLVPATGCLMREKNIDKKTCSFYTQKLNGDGIRGYYLSNIVYFEENNNPSTPALKKVYRSHALPLGCTLGEYGRFKDINTDGVMGLSNNKGSFTSVLYNLKIINKNIFSLCFGLEGGYMSIGEIDTTYHMSKQINYVPFYNLSHYIITINGIQVDKNKQEKINFNATIDSGTTLTYLPRELYKNFIKQFEQICTNKKGENICGKFNIDENFGYCASFDNNKSMLKTIANWPTITLELANYFPYIWQPINYYYVKSDMKTACIGIMKYNYRYITLGANFMHGHDFIFDREKSLLGIVPSDCSRRNIMWNQMKNVKPVTSISPTSVVQKKKLLEDNVSKDEVEFIKGKNKELERISDFKLINFIILLICILVIVIFLLVVIIFLIVRKNNEYPKFRKIMTEESKGLNPPATVGIEEANEEPNEEKKEEKNEDKYDEDIKDEDKKDEDKKGEDKKDEKDDYENNDTAFLNETNDTKVTNDEVQFLKNMMKKSNKKK